MFFLLKIKDKVVVKYSELCMAKHPACYKYKLLI